MSSSFVCLHCCDAIYNHGPYSYGLISVLIRRWVSVMAKVVMACIVMAHKLTWPFDESSAMSSVLGVLALIVMIFMVTVIIPWILLLVARSSMISRVLLRYQYDAATAGSILFIGTATLPNPMSVYDGVPIVPFHETGYRHNYESRRLCHHHILYTTRTIFLNCAPIKATIRPEIWDWHYDSFASVAVLTICGA